MKSELQEKHHEETISNNTTSNILVLYNDDYHTFEYVIEALIQVCRHDYVQAEQCATITHYKGKCDVKSGPYEELKTFKEKLIEKELTVSIE